MDILQRTLEELGLSTLFERFRSKRIDAPMIMSLSDSELIRLGVDTIGDRHRLRETINQKLKNTANEPNETGTNNNITNSRGRMAQEIAQEQKAKVQQPLWQKKSQSRGWTVQFVCLANKGSRSIPTATEKEILLDADDEEEDVIKKLMSAEPCERNETMGFPQTLKLIDCCWSVREFKTTVGPQANIYIRPIQKNLLTKPLQTDSTREMLVKTSCHGCSKEFALRELRDHVQFCPGALDLQDLESDDDFVYDSDVEATNAETVIYAINSSTGTSNSANVNAVLHENNSSTATPLNDADIHVSLIVTKAIEYSRTGSISDPVEILKKLQDVIVTGRPLEVEDLTVCAEGDTNFILVDRINVLSTGMDEIIAITNLRKTLEVQFYNEVAADYGGPRKEFFRLILREIKENYFDNGLRELLASDYETIGKVFALSVLQNGKIPTFMSPNILEDLFNSTETSPCIVKLRHGLESLGLYQVGRQLPTFQYLFRSTLIPLTYKKLTSLVQPQFSEEGTNNNQFEKTVYAAFLRYLREVASGRRKAVCLESVLQFITGTDEEPVLGFKIPASIRFTSAESFLPTANTCINCLTLPRPSQTVKLPDDTTLFHLYDYSFANSFYGLK
ncbi:hypothetical protein ACJMK2_019829 [Sinanodonta woodiana]|uniref:HECT-type E3 ubiquitin transferase n=1 Tax=Sinanodonta woodiana TaxID=1069815 RepID=A0ABD3TZL6_SINWO